MENSSSSSAPQIRNRRTRRSKGPRLWSRDFPDYDNFTPTDYSCRICKQEIKKELLAHAKTWWERQLILMAMVFSGHKTKETAKREYQTLVKNYKKGFIKQGSFFYICRDHLAFVGERWLDFLCIQSPDDVMDAKETAVREAMDMMKFFNDKEIKFKSEKAFLEHCDQFISNEWHEILNLFPARTDVLREMEEENEPDISDQEGPSNWQGTNNNREVYRNEEEEAVYNQMSSETTVSKPALVEGECNVCGEHVTTGLVLTTDWNRRILLYMAFKNKIIKREQCKRLFLQNERMLTCLEHAEQSVEEIFAIFGTRDPSKFMSMYTGSVYTASHFTQTINRCFEDICRVFELWYETRAQWIKDVRVFVLTIANGERGSGAGPSAPSTSAVPSSSEAASPSRRSRRFQRENLWRRAKSCRPSQKTFSINTRVREKPRPSSVRSQPCTSKSLEGPSTSKSPEITSIKPSTSKQCSVSTRISNRLRDIDLSMEKTDVKNVKVNTEDTCHICNTKNENVVSLSSDSEIFCVSALLLASGWTEERISRLYSEQSQKNSKMKLVICRQHYQECGKELLKYLGIPDFNHFENANKRKVQSIRKLAERIDSTVTLPDDLLEKCIIFGKKCMK